MRRARSFRTSSGWLRYPLGLRLICPEQSINANSRKVTVISQNGNLLIRASGHDELFFCLRAVANKCGAAYVKSHIIGVRALEQTLAVANRSPTGDTDTEYNTGDVADRPSANRWPSVWFGGLV
jgi:hypothetical protein